jgi:hypothetical protein
LFDSGSKVHYLRCLFSIHNPSSFCFSIAHNLLAKATRLFYRDSLSLDCAPYYVNSYVLLFLFPVTVRVI